MNTRMPWADRDQVIDAVQQFHDERGRLPLLKEWEHATPDRSCARLPEDDPGLGVGEQPPRQLDLFGVAAAGRLQVGEPVDDGDVLDRSASGSFVHQRRRCSMRIRLPSGTPCLPRGR